MVLTDEEIYATWGIAKNEAYSFREFARAIESAVLEKLKAQGDVGVVIDNGTRGTTTILRNNDIGMIAYGTRLYEHPLPPDDVVRDAERYRWLRDTLSKSVGGGVEVNDAALVYEDCEPGEEVRLYWYPDTPIGFYEIKAKTLDAAIDAAMKEMK